MDSIIKIGIIGEKVGDVVMYLSRILQNLDQKVAVFDLSNEQHLKYSIPAINREAEVVDYRGVDFYCLRRCIDDHYKVEFHKYDIVFIIYGYHYYNIEDFMECDHKFLITDLERHSIMRLKETVQKIDKKIEVKRIFRDVVDCKINQGYIDNLLYNEEVEVMDDFALYINDVEMACRLESQYNDIFKFNKLPKVYKKTLCEVVQSLGFEKKGALKALKTAERGV